MALLIGITENLISEIGGDNSGKTSIVQQYISNKSETPSYNYYDESRHLYYTRAMCSHLLGDTFKSSTYMKEQYYADADALYYHCELYYMCIDFGVVLVWL